MNSQAPKPQIAPNGANGESGEIACPTPQHPQHPKGWGLGRGDAPEDETENHTPNLSLRARAREDALKEINL